MCTYEQKELGLSTYYDKRLVLPDGIHTEPIEYHLWSGGSSVWHERRAAPRARSHVWVHLFLICASFGCLWKSLGILRWNSLLAWHFMFCSRLNSPPTLATPSAKSTAGTCVLILIFAQHELIGEISKTQGNSQGWAPVLFINLVRILQLSRSADHEFDLSCCVIFSSVSTSVVSWLMSTFGKRSLDSARAFSFAAAATILACGVDSHFTKFIDILYRIYSNKRPTSN